MRITADTDRCIGAGQCVLTAADLFDQDEDGIVALLTDSVDSAADVELARQAEHLCPAAALRVTAADEGTTADATEGLRGA
ncbi:ferredoxin [Streptomyces sp. NPDC059567]|uniref:ferredoxin n=1 Tax=Streptomyces sp. NPDC059567 TaxID=3346867 RepID=UPI00367E22FE